MVITCVLLPTEVASEMLGSQEQNLKDSQKEILEDISAVRENIQGVWGRIGEEPEKGLRESVMPFPLQITGHRSYWVSYRTSQTTIRTLWTV